MSRNSQLSRTLRVIHYLELNPQGLRARDILQKLNDDGFSCSRETVYRDLDGIQAAMIPLANEGKGDTAVWKLSQLIVLTKGVHFTYSELMAFYVARESLKALQHSAVYEIIENFFLKLEKLLGPRAHQGLSELKGTLSVRPGPGWVTSVSSETLDTLIAACSEGHVIEIDYTATSGENAGKCVTRRLGPAYLKFADAGGYLLAWDFKDEKYKHYALPRIKRVVMTDEAFDSHGLPVDADSKDSLKVLSIGESEAVEIFVEEPMASYLSERLIHESQRTIRKENGVQIQMHVRVNDELARWVLGLGPTAEVARPESLRERVNEFASEIVKKSAAKKTA